MESKKQKCLPWARMNAQIFLWDLMSASGFWTNYVMMVGYSGIAFLATGQAEVGGSMVRLPPPHTHPQLKNTK